jgi:hypothetical protein
LADHLQQKRWLQSQPPKSQTILCSLAQKNVIRQSKLSPEKKENKTKKREKLR